MAHFAQLDQNNKVVQVIVINNDVCMIDGAESENAGIEFCKSLYGADTIWKQTSYNGSIRKNYAAIAYEYDYQLDAFIPPKPFNSWILNEETCNWQAPIPYPTDGKLYVWNENDLNWIESNN